MSVCREQYSGSVLHSGPASSSPKLHDICLETVIESLGLAGPMTASPAGTVARY